MKRILAVLLFAASVGAQNATPPPGSPPTVPFCDNCVFYVPAPPQPTIAISGTYILVIKDKDGKLMVQIDLDGKVTYGEGYKPDDSAKLFWKTLGETYPYMCVEYEKHRKPNPASFRIHVQPNAYLSIKLVN